MMTYVDCIERRSSNVVIRYNKYNYGDYIYHTILVIIHRAAIDKYGDHVCKCFIYPLLNIITAVTLAG